MKTKRSCDGAKLLQQWLAEMMSAGSSQLPRKPPALQGQRMQLTSQLAAGTYAQPEAMVWTSGLPQPLVSSLVTAKMLLPKMQTPHDKLI